MNSVKTKHYVNLRTASPSLHCTTGYSMLSASVWSIVCKWLITVVPFYLEYSQQGGFQENSTGQHVQERAWFGEAKGKGYSLRVHDIVSHNLLYISTCWCPLCLCSLQRAHFSASISFIFSSILQLFFLFLLPCQSSIVLPICRHFVKPREIVFLSVRTLFLNSSLIHLQCRSWWQTNEREMEETWTKKQLEQTKPTSCKGLWAVCVS